MVSGASLAYYTIFSLPPLLIIVFTIAGWFGVSQSRVDSLVKQQLGIPTTKFIQQDLNSDQSTKSRENGQTTVKEGKNAEKTPATAMGFFSRVAGIGILIFSATGLFVQLQTALNRAWEVKPDPDQSGVVTLVVKRLLSLGMVIVIAFLLLVSLVLTTLVDEIVRWIEGRTPETIFIVFSFVLNNIIVLVMATGLFAAMFKVLPDATTAWRDLWVSAAMTSVMFVIGKTVIGLYLQYSDVGSSWGGAAASMVAVLLWVYYSSLIVLFGAELSQVWAQQYGAGIRAESGAVRSEEQRHLPVG